jgi:hypothetical protein
MQINLIKKITEKLRPAQTQLLSIKIAQLITAKIGKIQVSIKSAISLRTLQVTINQLVICKNIK